MRRINPTTSVWTFAPFTALIGLRRQTPPRVWCFHIQALWSFVVVCDSSVTVRLHVALPHRQLSKAPLSQLWVTQCWWYQDSAIQMRSVLWTDAKWKEWKVFSLESSLCLIAHTMLLGRKSQKMSRTSKWVLLTGRIKSQLATYHLHTNHSVSAIHTILLLKIHRKGPSDAQRERLFQNNSRRTFLNAKLTHSCPSWAQEALIWLPGTQWHEQQLELTRGVNPTHSYRHHQAGGFSWEMQQAAGTSDRQSHFSPMLKLCFISHIATPQ